MTLWAISIQGPDDLVPVSDYLTALRTANAFNAWWTRYKTAKPLHEYDPRMWAIPVEWTGDPERHAEWVAKPSPDYAAFITAAGSDDRHTLITAIAGTDNYDHTLPVSYWVEVLAAERRRNSEEITLLNQKLNTCGWYWPEDDTSEDCCAESAQEVVQNAYDWMTPTGEVVAVARGGIVEVTYCAALPPADDSDSDDEFWVEESTQEAAKAKLDAEIARRARQPEPRS